MDYLSRQRLAPGEAAQSALHKGGNAAYIKRGFPKNSSRIGHDCRGPPWGPPWHEAKVPGLAPGLTRELR